MLGEATNINDVLLALIVAIPSILAAVFAGIVAMRTKMPNGTRMADAIQQTHAASADNNAMLHDQQGTTPVVPEAV